MEDFVGKPSANNLRRCFHLFIFVNGLKFESKAGSALKKTYNYF